MNNISLLNLEVRALKIKDELNALSESGLIQNVDLNFLHKQLSQIKDKLKEVQTKKPPLPRLGDESITGARR